MEVDLFLSQALFSSFEIDRGSRLLLQALEKTVDFSGITKVLDIGCGVGTLGIALKKKHPHIDITLQDRDALAVAFSRLNCEYNGLGEVGKSGGLNITGGLAFQGLETQVFDLIVSNIPAKVGEPVLTDLYQTMLECLPAKGLAALVVVEAISKYTLSVLHAAGAEIRMEHHLRGHTVILFSPGEDCSNDSMVQKNPTGDTLPPAYLRGHIRCDLEKTRYEVDTVWGSADFDSPPFTAHLVSRMSSRLPPFTRGFLWNPGQGHIPMLIASRSHEELFTLDCGGRDTLDLQICRHNLSLYAQRKVNSRFFHLPDPGELSTPADGYYDLLLVVLENLAGLPSRDSVLSAAQRLLKKGGVLLVLGKSAHVYPFGDRNRMFSQIFSKKYHGYRGVVLKRL